MLSTWGGNNGIDTISREELDCVGYDTCAEYCERYCWYYGIGYCNDCAYDKEFTKRRSAESEVEDDQRRSY